MKVLIVNKVKPEKTDYIPSERISLMMETINPADVMILLLKNNIIKLTLEFNEYHVSDWPSIQRKIISTINKIEVINSSRPI